MTRHTTATGGRRSAVLAVLTAHIALSVGLLGETAGGDGLLIGGSAWDVAALAVAVGLGVFKPGRRLGAPGDQAPGDQAPADQAPGDQAPGASGTRGPGTE